MKVAGGMSNIFDINDKKRNVQYLHPQVGLELIIDRNAKFPDEFPVQLQVHHMANGVSQSIVTNFTVDDVKHLVGQLNRLLRELKTKGY